MRLIGALLVVILTGSACTGAERGSPGDSTVADSADTAGDATDVAGSWPTDQAAWQLANIDSLRLTVPTCGESAVVGPDSAGPFVLGRPVSEIVELCPKARALWDWGDDAVPEPVLVVRLGTSRYELTFADTLADSPLTSISTSGTGARTAARVGPGTSLAELLEAYGEPVLFERECALFARFASAPGLAFRLEAPGRALECGDIPPVVEANDPTQLPSSTRVRTIVVTTA